MTHQAASLPDRSGGHKASPALVALVGPTAVGKTAASLYLAQRFDGEIVSADSRQLYRGLSIGTAKPTPAELALVPHHLIDCYQPDEPVSLADYLGRAAAVIAAIQARGRLPLLVGGSAQYVFGLLEGWQVPPVPPQPAIRQRLLAEPAARLHARLVEVDPTAAAAIGATNQRRLVRALEVWQVTGRPISAWQRRQPPAYRQLRLGLTLPRAQLHQRIAARVDAMLAAGLVAEVRGLLAAGYPPTLPAFSSMGYAETIAQLDGRLTPSQARQQIIVNTNRFVRHQMTWWRRATDIQWVDSDDWPAVLGRLAESVERWLADAAANAPGRVE